MTDVTDDEIERQVMVCVLSALKRRRGCVPSPEVLRELSALATAAATEELGRLGRADLGPLVATVTIEQPPRFESIGLGVRLGVARVTIVRASVDA